MEENQRLKMAIIAGAAHAIRYREINPTATEQEIIRHITNEAREILKKIDEEI